MSHATSSHATCHVPAGRRASAWRWGRSPPSAAWRASEATGSFGAAALARLPSQGSKAAGFGKVVHAPPATDAPEAKDL